MIFDGWFTDSVDVYRTSDVVNGYIKSQKREKTGTYDCRIYKSAKDGPLLSTEAGKIASTEVMAVKVGTDIISGDELLITRGGKLGQNTASRYFAGDIVSYYEPVGGAFNGLEHMEIGLLQEEVIK